MTRTAYHRAFYRDTAPRRRELANTRRECKRAVAWLLATLEWPPEPIPIAPKPYPFRRALLRLPRKP